MTCSTFFLPVWQDSSLHFSPWAKPSCWQVLLSLFVTSSRVNCSFEKFSSQRKTGGRAGIHTYVATTFSRSHRSAVSVSCDTWVVGGEMTWHLSLDTSHILGFFIFEDHLNIFWGQTLMTNYWTSLSRITEPWFHSQLCRKHFYSESYIHLLFLLFVVAFSHISVFPLHILSLCRPHSHTTTRFFSHPLMQPLRGDANKTAIYYISFIAR